MDSNTCVLFLNSVLSSVIPNQSNPRGSPGHLSIFALLNILLQFYNRYILPATPNPGADGTFTFTHLADAFIQSDLQLRNAISDTI